MFASYITENCFCKLISQTPIQFKQDFQFKQNYCIFLKLKSIDALWSRGSYIVVCNKSIFHYAFVIDDFCLAIVICHLVLGSVWDIFNCLHYGHLNFHPWSWWNFFRCSMWDSAGTWFTTSPSMAVTKASFKPKSCACTTYYVLTRSRDFYVCIEWYSKLQNKQKKSLHLVSGCVNFTKVKQNWMI